MLINITGGHDLTLFELDEAANRIREEVDQDANIIVGSTLDDTMAGVMRVSVVATGIDASEVQADIPVPRRSLSQPLRQSTQAPAPQAAAPAPQPAVAAAPAPQPVMTEARTEEPEPSLFGQLETERAAAEEQMEDIFEDEAQSPTAPVAQEDDGLPPPAYRPRFSDFHPQPDTLEAAPQDCVAPRAPAPGQPSAATLDRLKAAAARTRDDQPEAPAAHHAQEDDKPRFSVNSLIGRMTGNGGEPPVQSPRRGAHPPMQAQRPAPAAAPQADPEEDRIEIPAFLRRQAN